MLTLIMLHDWNRIFNSTATSLDGCATAFRYDVQERPRPQTLASLARIYFMKDAYLHKNRVVAIVAERLS